MRFLLCTVPGVLSFALLGRHRCLFHLDKVFKFVADLGHRRAITGIVSPHSVQQVDNLAAILPTNATDVRAGIQQWKPMPKFSICTLASFK